jgi:hypothetical protein
MIAVKPTTHRNVDYDHIRQLIRKDKKLSAQFFGFIGMKELTEESYECLTFALYHRMNNESLTDSEQSILIAFSDYQKTHDSKWICDFCGEIIQRYGYDLACPNGCFEDNILNGMSEDELEEDGINSSAYPPDQFTQEDYNSNLKKIMHLDPCENCPAEDCMCCGKHQ